MVLKNGFKTNEDSDFSSTKTKFGDKFRFLSSQIFNKKLKNGEVRKRDFLSFSQSKNALYCVPCLLFGGTSNFATKDGCSDWKNISSLVENHENSRGHRECSLTMIQLKSKGGVFEENFLKCVQSEVEYWRNVLRRVVSVVKKLASRGLAFRGSNERFYDQHNGNFLMAMELLAEYDPFLKQHIKQHANKGPGHVSYLSSRICDEFIEIMGMETQKRIIDEIIEAKYYSVVLDSTPDISNVDQLSFVFRYVSKDKAEPVERFLKFLDNSGHGSEELFQHLTSFLKEVNLDIANCRGQSYDNAPNMNGIYNGVQAKVLSVNKCALNSPCACHSLNLIGEESVKSCSAATHFFMFVEKIYTFFSCSTKRWDNLKKAIGSKKVPKNLSKTRWSTRADACGALYDSYKEILAELDSISNDLTKKPTTRAEASGLAKQMRKFETAILLTIWKTILERIDKVNKKLQSANVTLTVVVDLYNSLINYLIESSANFELFLKEAENIASTTEFKQQRIRKKRRHFDELEVEMPVQENTMEYFKNNVFNVVFSTLIQELRDRKKAYDNIYQLFECFENFPSSNDELNHKISKLCSLYTEDLEEEILKQETIHFQQILKTSDASNSTIAVQYKYMIEKGYVEIFSNLEVVYRMYLSMAVTNCSAERSFSTLKRIKTYIRSTLSEEKLNHLAIMSIEFEILDQIDFESIIDVFLSKKCRKKI